MKTMEPLGYHVEWNLGSPGGWDYQRMAQEIARKAWKRLQAITGLSMPLDFEHPLFHPLPALAHMLLERHRELWGTRTPHIVLVAEEETLEEVPENINLIGHLRKKGVKAHLAAPHHLESRGDSIHLKGEEVTLIYLDMNNTDVIRLEKEGRAGALIEAMARGLVVNPRGMEPVGVQSVMEVMDGPLGKKLTETTRRWTPWTRLFYPRSTRGPKGEEIQDLVEWTRRHRDHLVLKPAQGHSGKGVFVGPLRDDWDRCIQEALHRGDYIVQALVPIPLWSEPFPWLEKGETVLKVFQTDFRCLVGPGGILGAVSRFGGIPTNVGSGGGNNALALVPSETSVKEAVETINRAIAKAPFHLLEEVKEEMEEEAMRLGHTYLLGPIKSTLRPRLLHPRHLDFLSLYAKNLWKDCVKLEAMWRAGALDSVVKLSPRERELALLQPWRGSAGLVASDGLMGFGAQELVEGQE